MLALEIYFDDYENAPWTKVFEVEDVAEAIARVNSFRSDSDFSSASLWERKYVSVPEFED